MIPLKVFPILSLDKDYEIKHHLKHVYTNRNYVDSGNFLTTRKCHEFFLVDTGLVDIEHELADKFDPDSIAYSKFTIRKIVSPFTWPVDHLQTPISLSKRFNPQTYNWYDYKQTWENFLYVRPTTHTWFVKYCP